MGEQERPGTMSWKDCSGWIQVLVLEAKLGHRVAVEDVDAAAAIDEDSRELAGAPRDGCWVEDEGCRGS